MDAIFSARSDLRGCDIYVARYRTIGSGLALPCSKCYEIIKNAGIRNIYFTTSSDSFSYAMIKSEEYENINF